MIILRTVVLTAAFAALLSLPCALAVMIIRSDSAAGRRVWSRRSRAEQATYRCLERGLQAVPPPIRSGPPTIAHAAAELRRLDQQRQIGPTYGSEMWLGAVLRAYDEWLQVACGCLGISQHLASLRGLDRQIERVRMEGELTAAGLHLSSFAYRRAE